MITSDGEEIVVVVVVVVHSSLVYDAQNEAMDNRERKVSLPLARVSAA
jgi:molybdopterin synthase catalytic subunit